MLDQNMLNSVLSSGGVARPELKAKEDGGDAAAFNSALNDASAAPKSKKADKEETKAEAKDSKDKKREAKEHEDAKLAHKPQDRTGAIHIKKLMAKNVDTMSLAEKQAMRLAEFANQDQQNVKTQPQLAQQPQAQPQAAKAGRTTKAPTEMVGGREASAKVRGEADRADDKQLQAAEELQKKDQGKTSSSSNLDQLLVKESSFADELRKTSSADKARERQSVIDQILAQIEVRNFANRTELNLKLNPEYLGELKVKLVHTDDGIRADFETSSKATREILREGEEDLKAQAKEKGVRFRTMRVTLVDKMDDAGGKG
jgi:flagellar hook-length control protein FliK